MSAGWMIIPVGLLGLTLVATTPDNSVPDQLAECLAVVEMLNADLDECESRCEAREGEPGFMGPLGEAMLGGTWHDRFIRDNCKRCGECCGE